MDLCLILINHVHIQIYTACTLLIDRPYSQVQKSIRLVDCPYKNGHWLDLINRLYARFRSIHAWLSLTFVQLCPYTCTHFWINQPYTNGLLVMWSLSINRAHTWMVIAYTRDAHTVLRSTFYIASLMRSTDEKISQAVLVELTGEKSTRRSQSTYWAPLTYKLTFNWLHQLWSMNSIHWLCARLRLLTSIHKCLHAFSFVFFKVGVSLQ